MKFKFVSLVAIISVLIACNSFSEKGSTEKSSSSGLYLIETSFGDMTIKLYDETPIHKANFEKLVGEKFYDGTLFHRIIEGFMVQGGDPQSRGSVAGASLGSGGPGYTIPAEINDTLIHKKGALAAARQGDQVNPKRESSGSQFYIVQGKPMSRENLLQMEGNINNAKRQAIGAHLFNSPKNKELKDQVQYHQSLRNTDSVNYYIQQIESQINDTFPSVAFKYSDKAIETYSTIGGTAMLDGSYTVFGEIVEGLSVLDSIAKVQKDAGDRPLEDIEMTIKKL